jgi:hypothetical protein
MALRRKAKGIRQRFCWLRKEIRMKDQYKVVLQCDGIDNFHTVMKVVEGSEGITVLNRELLLIDAPNKKRKKRAWHNHRADSMNVLLIEHAAKFKDKTFTRGDVEEWLVKLGRAPTSASPLTSQLVKEGKLIKVAEKTFKLP